MLKNIPPILSPELLKVLCEMGHGDEIILADGNFPAESIGKAKAIDGVYDSDPKTNPDAKRYDEVSIQEVIDKQLAVVDLTASILSMENKMPMYVFGLNEENSIVKAISGDFNGTKVTV